MHDSPCIQCSNVVVVELDSGEVTPKELEIPLAALPLHAEDTFKQRWVGWVDTSIMECFFMKSYWGYTTFVANEGLK